MGPGGAVSINLLAIDKVLDYLFVPLDSRLDLAGGVQKLANLYLAEIRKKDDNNRSKGRHGKK
jgi:hypothetical protein